MTRYGKRIIGKRIADRYCITGEIGKGGMGIVYRAIPFDDPSHSVAIKVIQRTGKLSHEDLMRFQKEASLMSLLHHPNIVVFHELGLFDGDGDDSLGSGYFIVMEIADGTNLKQTLARDGRKDLAFFFEVGLQVSSALDYTHGKNIIHRDIKPQNIIVGQTFRDQRGISVKVLDFGVARLFEAMHDTGSKEGNPRPLDEAAGTPLYMAPEQTRLLDAPVDHRVDLYSLGCVLYEVLTGKPPFTANSRDKLEKQHVFAEAEPLTNLRPDVPAIVEKIVHKLLAKHPKDRYQTAFALHADLVRARNLFQKRTRRQKASFPLGLKDRFQAVSAQLELIGREKEFDSLVSGFENVSTARGRSRLTLIKGAAGIGKSRLLAEFRGYLAKRKVRSVFVTFSQHENSLPFNALANAFNEYLIRVWKSQPHEAEELRRRIKAMLGSTAHEVAVVVPGLKPFLSEIDEQEQNLDDEVKPDDDNFARFAKIFSDFTRCLTADNQPVVFMFDDLHWADDKSLRLIDQFFTNANTQPFYMIVTQRNSSKYETERFIEFISKFRKLKRRFHELALDALGFEHVKDIASMMLQSPESMEEDLASYLHDASKGNPMHLVELTRTLVSLDLIAPVQDSGRWSYDIAQVRSTHVQINTIDLVLSRIQEYREDGRLILEIAATAGLTFQIETLLIDARFSGEAVNRTLGKALEDGLVSRITDEPELRSLGKTFCFTHKKARDAIYDAIDTTQRRHLHRLIGERLESFIQTPKEKHLFSLAHHFNFALDQGRTKDRELAERCIKYNVAAGSAAYSTKSWQTSETFFANALSILEDWHGGADGKVTGDLGNVEFSSSRNEVVEQLADVYAVQKRHGNAIKRYRDLLGSKLSREQYAKIAYKAVYFQMVSGVIGQSVRLIDETLGKLGSQVPRDGLSPTMNFAMTVAQEILPKISEKSSMKSVLRRIVANPEFAERLDLQHPAIRFYRLGSIVNLVDRPLLALRYHHLAFREAMSMRGSTAELLSVIAERTAVLSYLGFTKVSYAMFDATMDVAKSCNLRGVYGYVALLRVLTIDYLKARPDEISDHLTEALTYLSANTDRLNYGMALLFKIFRDLSRGNFASVYKYCRRMPDIVPTRNWISPRSVSLMLYGYLLQGSRDHIVRYGESYLKRRTQVAGRLDDLFVKIIKTLISFAKGEIDKARENYVATIHDFITSQKRIFLTPFEEDFVGLVAFTFPVLFKQEYGRHLMRESEMHALISRLKTRVEQIKGQDRTVPMLLRARALGLLGEHRQVKGLYDKAMRTAKIENNNLCRVLSYIWFGAYLIKTGSPGKVEYLKRAYRLAQKLDMKAFLDHTEKLLQAQGVVPRRKIASEAKEASKEVRSTLPSKFFAEHLLHTSDALDGDQDLQENLADSFAILGKHYRFKRAFCLMIDAEGKPERVVFQTDKLFDSQAIMDYVEPYVNIRSTLFLPMGDAPWSEEDTGRTQTKARHTSSRGSQGTSFGQRTSGRESSPVLELGTTATFHENEQTAVLDFRSSPTGAGDDLTSGDRTEVSDDGSSGTLQATGSAAHRLPGSHLAMSALVPMRFRAGTLGVVFMEDFVEVHNRDTTESRHDLDHFGGQMALILARKILAKSPSDGVHPLMGLEVPLAYEPATFNLEHSPWLKLWSRGRLRTDRETSWYLGLCLGEDQYLLVYCLLTGSLPVREKLGSMFWHHILVLRSLAEAAGRGDVDIREIQEEFAGIFSSFEKVTSLDNISLAFTIFDHDQKRAASGHFGPSRPIAVGVENVVTPSNDVVLHFTNGRALRFWEVNADLSDVHTYLLSYDSSKIDNSPTETAKKRVMASMAQSRGAVHQLLESVVMSENLPRYYVAAIMDPDVKLAALPELSKAEGL